MQCFRTVYQLNSFTADIITINYYDWIRDFLSFILNLKKHFLLVFVLLLFNVFCCLHMLYKTPGRVAVIVAQLIRV